MSLNAILRPSTEVTGGRRFFLVGYLPTCAALLVLLLEHGAGARAWQPPPGGGLDAGRARTAAADLGAGELVVLVLAVTLAAVVLQPLQVPLVRVLEGGWPRLLGSGAARRRQLTRKRAWERRATLRTWAGAALDDAEIQRAGRAGHELRRRFPLPDHLVCPTALGNALAAAEDGAGRPYGLDAVAAWPRLYLVLGDQTRAVVDDRRDAVDAAARLAALMALTALASGLLLVRTGWWLALSLAPLGLAWLAYRSAVQAALAYGESLHVAFDLHRFDLLTALRLPLPGEQAAERSLNAQLSDLWRQGVPLGPGVRYVHREEGETT